VVADVGAENKVNEVHGQKGQVARCCRVQPGTLTSQRAANYAFAMVLGQGHPLLCLKR
jgi:hypothetical protein